MQVGRKRLAPGEAQIAGVQEYGGLGLEGGLEGAADGQERFHSKRSAGRMMGSVPETPSVGNPLTQQTKDPPPHL